MSAKASAVESRLLQSLNFVNVLFGQFKPVIVGAPEDTTVNEHGGALLTNILEHVDTLERVASPETPILPHVLLCFETLHAMVNNGWIDALLPAFSDRLVELCTRVLSWSSDDLKVMGVTYADTKVRACTLCLWRASGVAPVSMVSAHVVRLTLVSISCAAGDQRRCGPAAARHQGSPPRHGCAARCRRCAASTSAGAVPRAQRRHRLPLLAVDPRVSPRQRRRSRSTGASSSCAALWEREWEGPRSALVLVCAGECARVCGAITMLRVGGPAQCMRLRTLLALCSVSFRGYVCLASSQRLSCRVIASCVCRR